LKELGGPVLCIFAQRESTWPEKMERFQAAMAAAGKVLESHSYDAGHGFANPRSERYDVQCCQDSWRVTQAFLARTLA
jgi:carboxymethylenebutenolidase